MAPHRRPTRAIAAAPAASDRRRTATSTKPTIATPNAPPQVRSGGRFVVQLHDIGGRYYELSLEVEGVMVTWSIVQGPSTDPTARRLALREGDRPVAADQLDGPARQDRAQAQPVLTWDWGQWRIEAGTEAAAGLTAGQFSFELQGTRMRGRWHLQRLKADGRRESWVLVKERDEWAAADAGLLERLTKNAVGGGSPSHLANAKAATRGVTGGVPELIPPMMPTRVRDLGVKSGHVFEVAYLGCRAQLAKCGTDVRLRACSGRDLTGLYPSISAHALSLEASRFVLDGELVRFSSPDAIEPITDPRRLDPAAADRAGFVAFDILTSGSFDVRHRPLGARRLLLAKVLKSAPHGGPIRSAPLLQGGVKRFPERATALGGRAIVIKDVASVYRAGPAQDWRQFRLPLQTQVIVVGYVASGPRRPSASFLIAERCGGTLRSRGRVSNGLCKGDFARLVDAPEPQDLGRSPPEVEGLGRVPTGTKWLEPGIKATITHSGLTPAGHYRAGRLIALAG